MNITATAFDSCHANLKSAKLTISLILIIPGIIINVSVVAALLRKVASLNGFRLLVLHLAFADLMVFFTATPFLILSAVKQKIAFTSPVCEGTAFFNRFTTISSMLILTSMAGCRFYSIKNPLRYRVNVNSSRINIACGLSWIFSLVLSVTPFLGWGEYEPIKGQCWCALDSAKHKLNYVTVLVLAFCLPTALSCYFLIGIIVTTRKSRKAITQEFNQADDKVVRTNLEATVAEVQASKSSSERLEKVVVQTNFDRSLKSFQNKGYNFEKAVKSSNVLPGIQIISLEPVMTPSTSASPDRKSSHLTEKSKQPNDCVELEKIDDKDQETRNEVFQSDTNEANANSNQKFHQQVKPFENNRKKRCQNANKALYNLIFLFSVYILCCGPTYLVWSWYAFSDFLKSKPPRALFATFRAMAGVQSVANALIYGIKHQENRKEVFKLWKDIAVYAKFKILNFVQS